MRIEGALKFETIACAGEKMWGNAVCELISTYSQTSLDAYNTFVYWSKQKTCWMYTPLSALVGYNSC